MRNDGVSIESFYGENKIVVCLSELGFLFRFVLARIVNPRYQNKLKVNDPNLYDYLQSHKYHIIKKVTETGVLYEVVVYKQ